MATVIAGIGQTAFGRLPGRDTLSLNAEACRKALADAGIEKGRVDGLMCKVPTSRVEMMYGQKLAEQRCVHLGASTVAPQQRHPIPVDYIADGRGFCGIGEHPSGGVLLQNCAREQSVHAEPTQRPGELPVRGAA